MRRRLVKTALLCSTALTMSFAQQQAQQPPPVQSPEVHSDGRVTFRLRDPDAKQVSVSLEGGKTPYVMKKDDQGVWSVTTDALQPDLYGYSFNADGLHLLDPSNTMIKPNLLSLSNVVHIPG